MQIPPEEHRARDRQQRHHGVERNAAHAAAGDQADALEHGRDRRDHQRRERAEQQAHRDEQTGQRHHAGARRVADLHQQQERRQAHHAPELMLRLIEQQPLQAVDRHRVIDPARHRVDVQIAHQIERRPELPQREELLGPSKLWNSTAATQAIAAAAGLSTKCRTNR